MADKNEKIQEGEVVEKPEKPEGEAPAEAEKAEAVEETAEETTKEEKVEEKKAEEQPVKEVKAKEGDGGEDEPEEQPKKEKKSHNGAVVAVSVVAIICSALSLTASLTGFTMSGFTRTINQITGNESDGNTVSFTEGTVADVANRVSPSVVSVVTETRVQGWYGQSSTASAAGTGVIVSKDGYILTNKHVIEGASEVSIVLDSGTKYESNEVEVIGTDPSNDIAFLKVKGATDLPAASLGDSKTLSVGQQVIAIGNALGQYQNTVTEGIVSGTGRTITASDSTGQNSERLTDMIQTDAAINAGNSGGPLVNAAGQVIGINTAVGSGNALGFAIPISSVKGLLKSIVNTGKLDRAYIGVYYDSLTAETAKNYNLNIRKGAYVHNSNGAGVIKDSPAEKAGVKDGDVIVKVGDAEVGTAGSLSTLVGEYAPGDTVTLTINRDGAIVTLQLTLGSYPTQTEQQN